MLSDYFKNRKFDRLFLLLKEKYCSLGRYSGTVQLEHLTRQEAQDLGNFFGYHLDEGTNFKTSFAKIEKKLKEGKYADFDWDDLFLSYFGYKIIPKKEKIEILKQEKIIFFDQIKNELKNQSFFESVIEEKGMIYQLIVKRYHKEKDFKTTLLLLFQTIERLDSLVPISLPMLSSFMTGNPHFYDLNTPNNHLFLKVLSTFYQEKEPKTTEEKINFLANHHIYIDTLSNYVTTYLLRSNAPFIDSFATFNEPLNINLKNLESVDFLDTNQKTVYVFENPSMLTALLPLKVPIVIVSGNPNYVVYRVLEKLSNSGNTIYYNGDFDPEGLLIANLLKEKIPDIQFFCYDEIDLEVSYSMERISDSRLKKMSNIRDPKLSVIKNLLLEKKVAGYQEKNIRRIEEFIKNRSENISVDAR